MTTTTTHVRDTSKLSTLILGAIGVVYGDIGTSPLYTLKEVFGGNHPVPVNDGNILGILSIIFWSLIIVVSLKYIMFVMRVNNHGEGGVVALTALALRKMGENHHNYFITMGLGMLGAGLFYGDSVITPAISVLSAIEGLQVATPSFQFVILPLTVIVLIFLFLFQVKGTGTVGQLFGPIMAFWFVSIAILGVLSIIEHPSVLYALNPYYAVAFFINNKIIGFVALGATFLALTGAEALYADMGHFGLKPIQLAWFWFILPALILNYFGQGALILKNPESISNPFYLLAPDWLLYPLVLLATTATIIASQAVISGTFSMTQEAIRLGYLPRMNIRFTSEEKKGQIYIPSINWLLFVAVIAVVLGFGTSDNLGAAYGLSVTGTMIITTILAFGVIGRVWKKQWWILALIFSVFFIVDLSFLGANSLKIMEGGWLPLFIAAIMFTLMTTWRKGARLLKEQIAKEAIPLETFMDNLPTVAPIRILGTGVFLTIDVTAVPRALLYNLIHNKVLHERVILLRVQIEDKPHVPEENRLEIHDLHNNEIYVIRVHYGFKDDINIPESLKNCEINGKKFILEETSFFIGKEAIYCSDLHQMAHWRKRLFIGMFRNSNSFFNYCKIPPTHVVELGTNIEL